jgi:cytoskeletal protein RodZ
MESVGEKLRQSRSRQGLTLDDISASTRISVKNLEAIEEDELSHISSAFLYRSFVRQFAQRVGLDYKDLATAVQSWASTIPEPAMPGQLQAALPKVPPLEPMRPRNFRWLFSFVALAAVLTGCSSLYAMWENSRYNLQASVSSFVKSLGATSGAETPKVVNSTKDTPRRTIRTAYQATSPLIPKPTSQMVAAEPRATAIGKRHSVDEILSEPFAVVLPSPQTEAGLRP